MKEDTRKLALEILALLKADTAGHNNDAWNVSGTLPEGAILHIQNARQTPHGAEATHLHLYIGLPNKWNRAGHSQRSYTPFEALKVSGNFAAAKGAKRIAAEFTRLILPDGLKFYNGVAQRVEASTQHEQSKRDALALVAKEIPGARLHYGPNSYHMDEAGRADLLSTHAECLAGTPGSLRVTAAGDKAVTVAFTCAPEIAAALVRQYLAAKSAE